MSEIRKILIVDDEPQITRVLRHSLMAHRFDIRTAADGLSGLETFKDWRPDLVITDLQMPEMDGIELCRKVRAVSDAPIIVLSVRGEEKTKVEALDAGADDYVTKPFGIDELLARIRSLLRRLPKKDDEDGGVLEAGDFRIDVAKHEVIVAGKQVKLTPKEFDLLVYLFRHRERVVTHRSLISAIWGSNFVEQTEYLRVFAGQIRKKIERSPAKPKYLITEPWVGYRFDPHGGTQG